MTESDTNDTLKWVLIVVGVTLILGAGIGVAALLASSSGDEEAATTSTTTTTTTASSTTTTDEAPTTTADVGTTTTTTEAPPSLTVQWIEAMAANEFPVAESLSSGSAEQFTIYRGIIYRLDPYGSDLGVVDTHTTDTSLTYTFDDGQQTVYDDIKVDSDKVADFNRNGEPMSQLVSIAPGEPGEAGGVEVTVLVVYHRPDPVYGHITYVTIEVDNQSNEEVYGYGAELIGSDRRSAEAETTYSSGYAPGVISEDVLVFLGSEIADGGELWISVDYQVTVKAPVPAVPPLG